MRNFQHNIIPQTIISSAVQDYHNGMSSLLVAKKYSVSPDTVIRHCRLQGIEIRNYKSASHRLNVNDEFFGNPQLEKPIYWLGFFSADGCIRKNQISLTLKMSDIEHIRKFKSDIQSEHNICIESKYQRATLIFRSDRMVHDLNELGVTERKSLSLSPCKQIPKRFLHHYWRGIIDGDGYINIKEKKLGLCGTFDVVTGFRDYLIQCGFHVYAKVSPIGNIYRFYTGTEFYEIYSQLYNNAKVFLNRKYYKRFL